MQGLKTYEDLQSDMDQARFKAERAHLLNLPKEEPPLKYWCHKSEFEQNEASLRHWGLHMRGEYYCVTTKCNNCEHPNEIMLRKGSVAPLNPTCENCGLPAHTQRIILFENVWTEPKPVK